MMSRRNFGHSRGFHATQNRSKVTHNIYNMAIMTNAGSDLLTASFPSKAAKWASCLMSSKFCSAIAFFSNMASDKTTADAP